jgi:hypothetical protein
MMSHKTVAYRFGSLFKEPHMPKLKTKTPSYRLHKESFPAYGRVDPLTISGSGFQEGVRLSLGMVSFPS